MKHIFLAILFFSNLSWAVSPCLVKESVSKDGGYKVLDLDGKKIEDVSAHKIVENIVFFSTSPLYGKPKVGMVDCASGKEETIVSPANTDRAYPDGSDYFKLKEVNKIDKNTYQIDYYYAPNIDMADFKKFENKSNLKTIKFTRGK